MGMDLVSVRGTSGSQVLSYNWAAWGFLIDKLNEWGVDTSELSWYNEGDLIGASTCVAVAGALEAHIDEIEDPRSREFFRKGIDAWRNCNGFCQW